MIVLRWDSGAWSARPSTRSSARRRSPLILGYLTKRPTWQLVERPTADGLGFESLEGNDVLGVVNYQVVDGLVTDVWMVVNPDKLAAWRS